MRTLPDLQPAHRFDIAPLWRACLFIFCLGCAIYLPLLASEPRRIGNAQDAVSVIPENLPPIATPGSRLLHGRMAAANAQASAPLVAGPSAN